jgi:CrcB protein
MMLSYFLVALGGAIGSVLRHWIGVTTHEFEIALFPYDLMPDMFPWPTLWINLLGSLVIGFIANVPVSHISPEIRTFFMVGLCGGFTTFSSFSLQTLDLIMSGSTPAAFLYMGFSVLLCLFTVSLGYWVAGLLFY